MAFYNYCGKWVIQTDNNISNLSSYMYKSMSVYLFFNLDKRDQRRFLLNLLLIPNMRFLCFTKETTQKNLFIMNNKIKLYICGSSLPNKHRLCSKINSVY